MSELSEVKTLGEALASAGAAPARRGYAFREREITFREMDEASDRFAASLLRLGYRKGDRIAVNAFNQPEWLVAFFGAAKIGVITVGLSVRYRDVELEHILNQSETLAVVSVARAGDIDYRAFFASLRPRLPTVRDFIYIGGEPDGALTFEALVTEPIGPPLDRAALDRAKAEVRPDDIAIVLYTSGTTGCPKGAAITHKSQLASARAQARHARVRESDVLLLPMPLNHVGGITCGVVTALLGHATCVLLPEFDPAGAIEQAKRWSATIWSAVPTMHTLLLMSPRLRELDSSQFRLVITGGSNAEPALLRRLAESFPVATIMNLYGLSESSGALVMSAWESDFDTTVKSIGRPIGDFEMRIVCEHGTPVRPGTIGELQFKCDANASGYFRQPDESAEVFDEAGWLHTGDLGYIDQEGNVILMGRMKDMYIQGGFNIYPLEVENLISKHPKVHLAAGIGIPDPVMGEVGRYYIVPRDGMAPTQEEILAFCREHLADYKIPRQILIRKDLPLTPAGKVMKSRLRDELYNHNRYH